MVMALMATTAWSDESAGAVHVYHPITSGFTVQTQTVGGYCYYNVTNDYRVIFKYDQSEPNLPTFSVTTQGSYAILKAVSNNSGVETNKRCCHWKYGPIETGREIDAWGVSCIAGQGGCQEATLECSSGWTNCPAGWGDPNAIVMINYP